MTSVWEAILALRRPDPRIVAQIRGALGDVRRVVNVGAGTRSYEPADLDVVAVEPSAVMRGGALGGDAGAAPGRSRAVPGCPGRELALRRSGVRRCTGRAHRSSLG